MLLPAPVFTIMDYYLSIGELIISVQTPNPVVTEESIIPFLRTSCPHSPDIQISFCHNFDLAPTISVPPAGEDILLRYYLREDSLICEAIGGPRGPLALSVSHKDYSQWTSYLNTENYQTPISLSNLMRYIPMHFVLLQKNALFIHASQIAVQGRGILFSAPSGTGKTTQAKLWRKYRNAKIICNDRTLVRNGFTYGYPADGSEPVYSDEVYPLGAIVLLKQSPENRIIRLKPTIAIPKLMQQLVFSSWSSEAIELASKQLLELITAYPVYQLECTPDEDAVTCLETCLRKEGVIS